MSFSADVSDISILSRTTDRDFKVSCPSSPVASLIARISLDALLCEEVAFCGRLLYEDSFSPISSAISFGMLDIETASDRDWASSKFFTILDLDEPHLEQLIDELPIVPNEWPHSHLFRAHLPISENSIDGY